MYRKEFVTSKTKYENHNDFYRAHSIYVLGEMFMCIMEEKRSVHCVPWTAPDVSGPCLVLVLRTPLNFVFLYSQIGDRVMAFVNYNAWAEVVCTPVEFVYKIPDDMSFSEAAAFPMNFVTAYTMLFEIANLREGMSVLVHSAGGGVVSLLFVVLFLQGHDGTNGIEIDNAVLM